MTLLSPTNTSLSFHPQVDEWLEMERTCLRHEKDTSLEKVNSVYSSLEATLQANGGMYLVGKSLSAADIAVIVTLSHFKSSRITPLIQSYLDRHVASEEFGKGHDLLQTLVPPPPFDWKREPSVLKAVTRVFQSAVSMAFPTLSDLSIKVERAKHAKFGDYQCIAGVQIFQKLKQDSNVVVGEEFSSPNVVAQRILTAIDPENGVIDVSSLEVSGFGFIHCKVAASYLDYHVNSIVQTGKVSDFQHVWRILFGFSDVNSIVYQWERSLYRNLCPSKVKLSLWTFQVRILPRICMWVIYEVPLLVNLLLGFLNLSARM
jgi:hypothetical protein